MAYVTQQDLVDRFGAQELIQLTDRTNMPPSTIDGVVVGRAIADAEALANGYIGKAYDLPIAPAPEVLTKMCADIARYFLHGKAADKDSQVTRAFNEAVAWLKDVARGLVQIDTGGVIPPAAGGGSVKAKPSDRVMTRESLRGA